jgi:hypothetical protein
MRGIGIEAIAVTVKCWPHVELLATAVRRAVGCKTSEYPYGGCATMAPAASSTFISNPGKEESMKLQMHSVVVEVTDSEEVNVSQPGKEGAVNVSVEQVPFLIDLLQQAKSRIEEMRYRRQQE